MKYRTLGKTGIKVSEVGFGSWAIGGRSEEAGTPWGWGEVPEGEAIAAVRRSLDLGVNFFDTADVYGDGRSEEVLGKALSSDWDKVYVATKAGNVVRDGQPGKDWSRKHLVRSCEASLKRLKKDVIDVYQLHNPEVNDIRTGDWPETMELLREQGKIRWYGVSVFLPEEGLAVLERGQGHTLQVAYNALRLEMEESVFPLARKKDFGVIARVPLYYGVLTGKYRADTVFPGDDHRSHTLPPETMRELVPRAERIRQVAGTGTDSAAFGQWSLKFVLANPAVSAVIPGARNARQAELNARASDWAIAADQVEATRTAWRGDEYLRRLRTEL